MQLIPSELEPLQEHVRALNAGMTDRSLCYYCGETSQAEDHVIPHSLTHGQGTKRQGWERDTLPACHECNRQLSNHVFDTLPERSLYLVKTYRKRFAKWLRAESWATDELEALSYSMRQIAEAFNDTRDATLRRLAHLEARASDVAPFALPSDPWEGVEIDTRTRPLVIQWNRACKAMAKRKAAKPQRLIPQVNGYSQ